MPRDSLKPFKRFWRMRVTSVFWAHLKNSDSNWTSGPWQRSNTYFKLALVPQENRRTRLDVPDENKFTKLIHTNYRRIASNLVGASSVARDAANRSADFYEYRWYHRNLDYESRWRITNRLDVAHATQVEVEDQWSLVDIVMYTILLLKVGARWWSALGYFGDGILFAEMSVGALKIRRGAAGQFMKLFGPAEGDPAMAADVLVVDPQRGASQAYVPVNSATLLDNIPHIVSSIMNPLLRSLGHGVVSGKFEDSVRHVARPIRLA